MASKVAKKRSAATEKAAPPTAEEKSQTDKLLADCALLPSTNAAVTVSDFGKMFGQQNLGALIDELRATSKEVANGDMTRVEAMLVMQAHSLQAIFTNMTHRAISAEFLPQLQTFMNLGLKAQAQCRCTLEALAEIKAPKSPTFVRQQNIGYQQQVNNQGAGINGDVRAPARTGESANQSNELLEAKPHKRLDSGTAQTASGTDTQMETVGAIHGATE